MQVKDYLKQKNIKPLYWQGEDKNFPIFPETENFNSDQEFMKTVAKTSSFCNGLKPCPVPKIEDKKAIKQIKTREDIEPNDGRPSFEYRWQRYEWHLKNGFENDKDVVWFKEYELSDEYRQMYGEKEYESKIC